MCCQIGCQVPALVRCLLRVFCCAVSGAKPKQEPSVTVTYRHSEDYCFEDAAERLSAFAEHRGPQLGPVYPLSVAQLQATLGYCRDEVFVGTPRLAQELGVSHSILAGAEAVLQILEWLPVLVVRKGRRIVFINGDEFAVSEQRLELCGHD
jgi:hypothetical protein